MFAYFFGLEGLIQENIVFYFRIFHLCSQKIRFYIKSSFPLINTVGCPYKWTGAVQTHVVQGSNCDALFHLILPVGFVSLQ